MVAPLVSTVFSTGPKDSLAAADVYKAVPGKAVVNSIQALSEKIGIDVSSILGGKANVNEALGKVLKMSSGSLKIDTNVLTARLLSTKENLSSSYRGLSDAAKEHMGELIDMESTMMVDINGVVSEVQSSNIDSINGLGNFLGQYTGNKEICKREDADAIGGMIGGLVSEGSDLKISGIFPALTSAIDNASIVFKAATSALPKLIKNGDLNSIFDISASPIGKSIGAVYPSLGKEISKAISIAVGGNRNYTGEFTKYIGIMDNVFRDWDIHRRQNGEDEAVNIFQFIYSSRSFQELIVSGAKSLFANDDPRKMYLLYGMFKETTVHQEVRRFFPRTVLMSKEQRPSINSSRNTIDPRTLVQLGSIVGMILTD